MASILYTFTGDLGTSVYANITNKCNCSCTFCVRQKVAGLGDADELWHKTEPTIGQIKEAVESYNFDGFDTVVFCGYGEPTCVLDKLIESATYVKSVYGLSTRLNTNGLGSLQAGYDIVPRLAEVFDAVSISLNAPNAEEYRRIVRPAFDDAFAGMLSFTRRCSELIPDVAMTVVDILPDEDIKASKMLAASCNARLRVRHYSPN